MNASIQPLLVSVAGWMSRRQQEVIEGMGIGKRKPLRGKMALAEAGMTGPLHALPWTENSAPAAPPAGRGLFVLSGAAQQWSEKASERN